jgi:hypothetical protein
MLCQLGAQADYGTILRRWLPDSSSEPRLADACR